MSDPSQLDPSAKQGQDWLVPGWESGERILNLGFPGGSDGKESAGNAGDPGSIPGSGRFPGEGNGDPLQYF